MVYFRFIVSFHLWNLYPAPKQIIQDYLFRLLTMFPHKLSCLIPAFLAVWPGDAGHFLPLYRLYGLPAILFLFVPWNEDINLIRLPEALTHPQDQSGVLQLPQGPLLCLCAAPQLGPRHGQAGWPAQQRIAFLYASRYNGIVSRILRRKNLSIKRYPV